LVRSSSTVTFQFRIPFPTVSLTPSAPSASSTLPSNQVQNLRKSKAAKAYRKYNGGGASDKPIGDPWPVLEYGEPSSCDRLDANAAHEAKDEIILPVYTRKEPKADTESSANGETETEEPQDLHLKIEYLSCDSEITIVRIEKTSANILKSSAEQYVKLKTETLTNGQEGAGIKRRRDIGEEQHDAKRQRKQLGWENLQISCKADEIVTCVKTESRKPVLKRQRDSDIQEDEHISKRQPRRVVWNQVQTFYEDNKVVSSIKEDVKHFVLKREPNAEDKDGHNTKRQCLEAKQENSQVPEDKSRGESGS
jgi:hypothetical protein